MDEVTLGWRDADSAAGALRTAMEASRDSEERARLRRVLEAMKTAKHIYINDDIEEGVSQ